jgi:hypothetical protein
MPSFRSLIDPRGRTLGYHLDRLRRTLDGYRERLRQALAGALGEAVSDFVREAVTALLDEARSTRPPPSYTPRHYHPYSSPGYRREDPRDEYDRDYIPLDDEDDYDSPTRHAEARPLNWPLALAVGMRTSAWWLERRTGRRSLLVSLGLGAVTCAWVLRGGPLMVACLGLLASALSLAGLDALARYGAELLRQLGQP